MSSEVWKMLASSAKRRKDNLLGELAMSLIRIKNNQEPEVDTCGTPQVISNKLDFSFPI